MNQLIKNNKGAVVAMAIILAITIAVNVAAGLFADVITNFLFGWGVSFDGEEFEKTAAESDKLCEEIAGEGIVMLENNGALPLASAGNVNVFGWGATDGGFVMSGSGSGNSVGTQKTTLLQSLEQSGFTVNQEIISALTNFQSKREGSSLGSTEEVFYRMYELSAETYNGLLDNALAFSDTAIVVISRLGGEGRDLPFKQYKRTDKGNSTDANRTYLQLTTEEEDMLYLVSNAGFQNVILLINSCNVMELGFIEYYPGIDSVLTIGALGINGAKAVGKMLKGEILPSGKTVDTYAYSMMDDPTYANAASKGVTNYSNGGKYIDYVEDIYVGYRYYETAAHEGFIDYDNAVQYPFGYGLTYTSFEWEVTQTIPSAGATLEKGQDITVKVMVTNVGQQSGQDVVQLYYTAPYVNGEVEKAYVNLCAFAKTEVLKPGQSQELTLKFNLFDMASYDCYDKNNNGSATYELDAGNYEIKLQTDSHTVKRCENAVINYTVSQDIIYDTDPVTGEKVENRFTGANAYGGVAIDGSTSNANIVYLSRADFAGTFPYAKAASRSKGYTIGSNWYDKNATVDQTVPGQGIASGLLLTSNNTINDELMRSLGSDYDNPLWDDLVSQMSTKDLERLIQEGGYRTAKIDSIGKPLCYDFDGPSGLNTNNSSMSSTKWTAFPSETTIASTWNTWLSYTFGLAVGKEASDTGVSGWYAPAVNIHRSPFGGRNYEYYSEDPMLSGIMGAETVKGAMTNGLYCYVKHFIVNETETDRGGLNTWLTEQALREIYLRPFEICVKQGKANAIMTSFNNLGAIWTGGNKALMTDILRTEWGFRGSTVTDYADGTSDGWMNYNQGLRAGQDLWLAGAYPGGIYMNISMSSNTDMYYVRQACKNILYTYANTYYVAVTTDVDSDRFGGTIGYKGQEENSYWAVTLILVAIDVVALGGIALWVLKLIKKGQIATKVSEVNDDN